MTLEHIRPESLQDLLKAIDAADYTLFAGGTDLMIRKRQWQGASRRFEEPIAFINQLKELRGIEDLGEHYRIGALTTQEEMATSGILPDYLKEPYHQMATLAIRNIATVGGNIINAASVGDSLPLLMALDAEVVLESLAGERTLPVTELIIDKYRTRRKRNEVLTRVMIPKEDFTGYYYKKLGQRKASILSKLSIVILYRKREILEDLRIAVGAVNDKPVRLPAAEKTLLATGDLAGYLKSLSVAFESADDKRSTKEYRETVSLALIKQELEKLFL